MRVLFAFLFATATFAQTPAQHVSKVLDQWHRAAAAADESRYFGYFAPNGVFMGTDATERWSVAEFRKWARPHFASRKTWDFHPRDRHIAFSPDGSIAWFDEMLDTPNMGVCRGSGVVVKLGADWKIAQYNLSVPIPNSLNHEIVTRIRGTSPALH